MDAPLSKRSKTVAVDEALRQTGYEGVTDRGELHEHTWAESERK